MKLEIQGHQFKNRSIPTRWLSNLSYKIDELSIISSNLDSFEDEAFNSTTFNDLMDMTINGEFPEETTLSFSNGRGFSGLKSLEKLEIMNYVSIHSNETLQGISHSLCALSITNIESTIFLRSLFGWTTFDKIKSLNITWNQFSSTMFSSILFTGLQESLKRLYMQNSRVTTINSGTFDNFINIEVINLQNNNIFSLPIGLFDNFLSNPKFKVYLGNNPWRCDMDICHLLPFINTENDNVTCASPPSLIGNILNETMCIATTLEVETPTTTTTEGNFNFHLNNF